jgi:hypothetical protein
MIEMKRENIMSRDLGGDDGIYGPDIGRSELSSSAFRIPGSPVFEFAGHE